jgi:putative tryptophan/tyrosine transport system substrate-binding protein
MCRRSFLIGAAATLAVAGRANAQPSSDRVARIGVLSVVAAPAMKLFLESLRDGLAALGYVEGRHYALDARSAEDDPEQVSRLFRELESLSVSLIVTQGPATYIVSKIERRVPVVFALSGDPIEAGITRSLARPGGTMTGQTYLSVELNGKRIELLRDALPHIQRIAIIANPTHPGEHLEIADSRDAAKRFGINVDYLAATNPREIDAALVRLEGAPTDAIIVLPDALMVQERKRVIDFAHRQRVPVVSGWALFANSGALFTYGPNLTASYRRVAYYVDRILKGASPAELPIERPAVLELVVNVRAARELGIELPPEFLARADEVIE